MAVDRELRPLVSIIIPTYNYGYLIIETLLSVLRQSYKNWECIVVDDESSDNTLQVVGDFISAHKGYNFMYHRIKNGGTSIAKNTGIQLAKGEYFQFLDADDLLSPDKLSIQVAIACREKAGLIFSKSLFFSGPSANPQHVAKYPLGFLATQSLAGYELVERLICNNILTISSPLVRHDLVLSAGCFNANLNNNEDWLIWFKVAMLCQKFIYDDCPDSFVNIRVHGSSAMTNHQNMFRGEIVVRNYIHEELLQHKNDMETGRLLGLNLDLLALHHLRSVNITEGLRHILISFVKHPVQSLPLLGKGLLKLATRFYKNIIK